MVALNYYGQHTRYRQLQYEDMRHGSVELHTLQGTSTDILNNSVILVRSAAAGNISRRELLCFI